MNIIVNLHITLFGVSDNELTYRRQGVGDNELAEFPNPVQSVPYRQGTHGYGREETELGVSVDTAL